MAMAASISRNGGKVLAITCRPSPLTSMAGRPGVADVVDGLTTSPTDLSALLDQVGVERLAVLVDDAEIIADAPLGETLIGFLRAGRDRGAGLVAAGTAGEMGQFRGFIPEVRKSRSGLLLCPATVADGDVVGVRLPRTAVFAGPPGRAVMVVAGAMTLIQVPFYDLT
jgi:S-DNA-T family DNA segregation ATPase FtsK/SpoIIIE